MTVVLAVSLVLLGALGMLFGVLLIGVIRHRSRAAGVKREPRAWPRAPVVRLLRGLTLRRRRRASRVPAPAPTPEAEASGAGLTEPDRLMPPAPRRPQRASPSINGAGGTVDVAVLTAEAEDAVAGPRDEPPAPASAVQLSGPMADVGVRVIGGNLLVKVPQGGDPVIIGSSVAAAIRVPGEAAQAAIVFSDGVPMVTRLTEGLMRLGTVEVGAVGVPITPSASQLVLDGAVLDLSAFLPSTPPVPMLMRWAARETMVGAAQMRGCAAVMFGANGQTVAEHIVSCFSGIGRRSAIWALEAGNGGIRSRTIGCAVGIAEVDDEYLVLVAAQAGGLRVVLEPAQRPLPTTLERQGVRTAEYALERDDGHGAGGELPTRVRLWLYDEIEEPILEGALPLALVRDEIARRRRASAQTS